MQGMTGTPLRVLVVDDNADTAASLAFLLEAWGHEARVAHDGPSAILAARAFRPGAILLDVGLPHLDGFEVARRLRSLPEFAQTPIIASSGYDGEEHRRRASEVGITLYLVKPIDPWRLADLLAPRRSPTEAVTA